MEKSLLKWLHKKRSHSPSSDVGWEQVYGLWKSIILFILIISPATVWAEDDLKNSMISFDHSAIQKGYIDVRVPIYDENGKDEWITSGKILMNEQEMVYFSNNSQGDDNWYWIEMYRKTACPAAFTTPTYTDKGSGTYANVTYLLEVDKIHRYGFLKEGAQTYTKIRIYPPASILEAKTINTVVQISYAQSSSGGGTLGGNDQAQFTMPDSPSLNWAFSTNPGFQAVSFNGVANDSYTITGKNKQNITSSGLISVDYAVQNATRNVSLTYNKKISDYQYVTVTSSVKVPAYQHPTDLKAAMGSDGNVIISWSIPSIADCVTGDNFEVQRGEDENFSTYKSIGSVIFDGAKTYRMTDKTSTENLNGTFYYRLRRTKAAGWNWNYTKSTSTKLAMAHRYIGSASAKMIDDSQVMIFWDYDQGAIWSDNSDIMLKRTNEMKGTSEVYAIPRDSIMGKQYTERLLSTCDVYSYVIYAKPGNSNYQPQEAIKVTSQENLYTQEMGKILSLNASKGYFSDRVELEWITDGKAIDAFSIRARKYNSNDEFKQIDQLSGNVASTRYQYSDTKSVPGIIYEYQIAAIASCGGNNRMKESEKAIGFRTPTGDIYGRVTFENGQAVENAEVRAEGSAVTGKSYYFTNDSHLEIDNSALLDDQNVVTLQAWVKMAQNGNIIQKSGMYELSVVNGKPTFKVGNQTLTSTTDLSEYQNASLFTHLSAVASTDSVYLYIDGEQTAKAKRTGTVKANGSTVMIAGNNFIGNIDEVRIWGTALNAETIRRDYTRYLTGSEEGLLAYYTFDYAVDQSFFDLSYDGPDFHENHGTVKSAILDSNAIPSASQLGYKGITLADGSYAIRAIPYVGNGSSYTIIPYLGIHQFESQKEVRFINANAQSYTVNFTDKSSFNVSGVITYEGSTIPVEGVSFKIDGVTAVSGKGGILQSDAAGEFTISVPVGTHEVVAVKNHHVFANEGRFTTSEGLDINYQDDISAIKLYDRTTVRYIGRVSGGNIQNDLPIGHSLSKNNLADSIKVQLSFENAAYKVAIQPRIDRVAHFKPSNKKEALDNEVLFKDNVITVSVNQQTGEFVADVFPVSYGKKVIVPGYDGKIAGANEVLDLSNAFIEETSVYNYIDSTEVNDQWVKTAYSDTVSYNKSQKFKAIVEPQIQIVQVNGGGDELPYFGEKTTFGLQQSGDKETVNLYDEDKGTYLLGRPAFAQGVKYTLKASVFEGYDYYDAAGKIKTDVPMDKVPSTDAKVSFKATMFQSDAVEVEADSTGVALFTFPCAKVELTDAVANITATGKVGTDESAVAFDWATPLNNVIVFGTQTTGTSFVTAGPNKMLTVLRDPPGSNSYAYLEKGTSFKETSSYTGKVTNTGSESLTQNLGTQLITYSGSPLGGSIQSAATNTGFTVGVNHEESLGGTNTKESVTTTTTRFQTSDDPLYDGPNGDVYVGYSTNIVFGAANSINLVSREKLETVGESAYEKVYSSITPVNSDWVLVQQKCVSMGEQFATLFAYPQVHIENILIPNWESVRNGMFRFSTDKSEAAFQAEANESNKAIIVSRLNADDPNFGLSNTDDAFKTVADPDPKDPFNGPSYRIYFPRTQVLHTDSILYINQTIQGWKDQMAANEKAKVNATLLQNYSFHAGSPIEYSESYTATTTKSQTFSLLIGGNFQNETEVQLFGSGFNLNIDETVTTEHGGEFSNESEYSHSKGFVLAEEGDDDYLSVDVCYEKNSDITSEGGEEDDADNHYSSFIFKTKGGVTSCPYEGEYVTQYYQPGQHVINEATMQIEVPQIAVEKDFIENVPSGQPAYVTVYLRNNSEVQQEVWYDLKLDDTSNPNGARFSMDGGPIGNGRAMFLPAGETLVKTIEVSKGSAMEYDDLKLILISQCQGDASTFIPVIADTVSFSVHFTPSCTDVNIQKPTNNWTYNTKLPVMTQNELEKHYMDVVLNGFDVNYDNFNRIELQYKASSESDNDWRTLNVYYNDSTLYKAAVEKDQLAEMILASDAGTIRYKWLMDDLSDQRYDLRAVSICLINGLEIENPSETRSGIKDMYIPRLFGSAQPANGILSINDEIRLNFNEMIADGFLTKNNFQVTGIRNGSQTDHSVSVQLDGINDALETTQVRNWKDKNITAEMWINPDKAQNATLFSQGNVNNPFELGMTADNKLVVRIGSKEIVSTKAVPYDQGSWSHVAVSCDEDGNVSAYYNFVPYIDNMPTGMTLGEGNWGFGRSLVKNDTRFAGKMHNARIWNKLMTTGVLQTNSLTLLSGSESSLLAYYPMDETKGEVLTDKAQGINMAIKGAEWALPEGRSAQFDGASQYLLMNTGAAAVDNSMDYTMEFWFKADQSQSNSIMVSNGRGDGQDWGGSDNLFALGFENGMLTFHNNSVKAEATGNYLDNNWHHFALAVNRNTGRAQMVIDGALNNYFDVEGLGSIASDAICMGARRWIDPASENLTPTVDSYFKGAIDEFRLWNHYRNADMISNNNSKHLSGKEKGLLAYYPFETYIQGPIMTETKFTLADNKVQADPTTVIPDAVVTGGNVENIDKAPVKSQGPVQELNYTFVVNDDALIINLTEPWERVEKTIVNFTVDDVRDVNGNSIASPISWSAYIDRNQLKWAESEVNCETPVYEGKTFTVNLLNKGGSIQNYVIDNMPSWLKVTPASGSINPTASQTITFTVDKSLNVGTYNEVIYMHNDNNVIEALPINVKVNGEKPDWSVNPKAFKYNMNVYGKIRINNIFSSDKEDMLAAFVNGQCVGVTTNLYHEASDMWYAYLTVYNNAPVQDKMEFRIWDASTGKVYLADAGQTIGFKNNDVIGTAATPVIFDTREIVYQNIALESGWNWISFNVANDALSNVNTTLSNNSWKVGDVAKSEISGFDTYSSRSGWVGTLTDNGGFDNKSMFMIRTTDDKTLSVAGSQIDFAAQPINILGKRADGTARWNYIAYQPTIAQTVKEALSGYDAKAGDVIKSQDAFAMYADNLGWIGNLTYMEAGKGYMLQRNDATDATLTYSQLSSSKSASRKAVAARGEALYVNHTYAGNMNIVATLSNNFEVNAGDKIRAYVDGELRGEAALMQANNQNLFFININGDQAGALTFEVVRDNEPVAQAANAITYESNKVVGTVASPLELNFQQHKATGVYPNPFTEELNVVFAVAQGDKANVMISDIAGNILYQYAETAAAEGQMNLKWNGECLPGIYIVKVTVNNTVQVFKVEKK